MLPTRKIGALLRGKATPFQLVTGCALGAMIGFQPGFDAAPGLLGGLILLLILINANLLLATVVGLVGKVLSLIALPITFAVGRFLLEGPTEGLFRAAVNAPVLALCGFDNYVAVGGLLLGLVVGGAIGLLVARGITQFRRHMAEAGQSSTRFQQWNRKGWVRWSVFILVGGGLKDPDYAKLLEKRVGNPIRPLGAALVVFTVVLLVVGAKFFAPAIVTATLRDGLEQANGATVELESAELDLTSGRLVVTGLAAADPNHLDTNLFAADRIEADVSTSDLLRKRLTIDRVVVSGARLGQARRVAGKRVIPAVDSDDSRWGIPIPDAGTLDDYLNNAQLWRERLAQVRSWLDRLGSDADPTATDTAATETWDQKLARLAAEKGYAHVFAEGLVAHSPTLLVTDLQADKVEAAWLPGETLAVRAQNLSTQPWLVPAPATLSLASSADTAALTVSAGDQTALTAHYRGLPAETIASALKRDGGTPPLQGGTVDFAFNGTYSTADGSLSAPLAVTLHDTTVQVAGKAVTLTQFELPIEILGSLDHPRIKIDANQLGRLAKQAGTELLKDKAKSALGDKAGGLLDLLGGKKKP